MALLKNYVWPFCKKNFVLIIAIVAATITCFFVPFDKGYLEYFGEDNLRTLSCLFCTLLVVAAFRHIQFFTYLANIIIRKFGNIRNAIAALIFITYFGSMIMANDMALVTFLPLGYFVLSSCNKKKYYAFCFIMQNIAANLGGMLTPFGNPQNLYIYSYFNVPLAEFLKTMVIPFVVALILIIISCFFVKKEDIEVEYSNPFKPAVWRVVIYSLLFIIAILIVFNIFPYYYGLIAVIIGIAICDYKSFGHVDYGLLLTFTAFFIFSGNLSRIETVRNLFETLLNKSVLIFSTLSCQVISNVPSAILLSKFTTNYQALLIGVNIGGLGTPIASLASLITLNFNRKVNPGHTKNYLLMFLGINFLFLIILLFVSYFIV